MLLQHLHEHRALADVDIFLLPVNADGIHWFLLSADVRGGQCVVRVHEPYGTDAAESRTLFVCLFVWFMVFQ